MNIGIAGLGLMGGSLAKAVKQYTPHRVTAADADGAVLAAALDAGAADGTGNFDQCELVFVCLYPRDAVDFMLRTQFMAGAVVTDICGVKRFIADQVAKPLARRGARYVGSHPMAGREASGFAASDAGLFKNASYIITKDETTDSAAVDFLARFVTELGFARVVETTPARHDRVIAYTSQLAHVVSNCYVKNDAAREQAGFTAGSFEDLTRVARLNPQMWAELFVENADFLSEDIGELIRRLKEVKRALDSNEESALRELLRQGSEIKEGLLGEGGGGK